MVTVTRVFLVRNGGAKIERPGQFVGQLDLPLSADGESKIDKLLQAFKEERMDRIYASPLVRAGSSAGIFSSFYGLDVLYNDGLREIDLGEFEGKTFEEIAEENPELAVKMSKNPVTFTYPGGESFLDLGERAHRAFWEIATRSEGKNVMVFSHGGVNRTILASLLGMPEEGIFKLEQDPAGITLVEVLNRFPRIRFLNVTVR